MSSPTAVGQNENTLIVTWGAPLQPNGTITQYTVSVFPYDGSGPIRSQTVPVRDELRGVFNADLGEFLCTSDCNIGLGQMILAS